MRIVLWIRYPPPNEMIWWMRIIAAEIEMLSPMWPDAKTKYLTDVVAIC